MPANFALSFPTPEAAETVSARLRAEGDDGLGQRLD
jgi:hypothetical protein